MAILSNAKARNLKPDDKPIAHGGVTGLALHPAAAKGHGKWVLRYVSPVTGKRRNTGLGSYPEVGVAEAARRGQEMRELLSKGLDPLEEKAKEKMVVHIPTFQQAAEKLHADLLPGWRNKRHREQWLSSLQRYAMPTLGSLLVGQIEPMLPVELSNL